MNTRQFSGIFSGLLALLAGCAESAIPEETDDIEETDAATEPVTEPDASVDGEDPDLDARVTPVRDASRAADAGDTSDAAPLTPRDAGVDVARPDASKPAQDAGRPDAAQLPVDAAMPPMCSGSQQQCGGKCVDTATDPAHCGGCGNVCESGQTCGGGTCMGATPSFTVPRGCASKTFQNHGYAFCTDSRTWEDARRACLDAKLDLALVDDQAENDFVRANGNSWFGASDLNDEREWLFVVPGNGGRTNGTPVGFTEWGSGEPNNTEKCDGVNIVVGCLGQRTDEDCGMLDANGNWNDAWCGERRGYVCETY